MEQYIPKSALIAEIEKKLKNVNLNYVCAGSHPSDSDTNKKLQYGISKNLQSLLSFINTLEVKEVDLMIHTIIAECCDWLAMNTNLSHDKIEGCRNLMLTVKEEQLSKPKED